MEIRFRVACDLHCFGWGFLSRRKAVLSSASAFLKGKSQVRIYTVQSFPSLLVMSEQSATSSGVDIAADSGNMDEAVVLSTTTDSIADSSTDKKDMSPSDTTTKLDGGAGAITTTSTSEKPVEKDDNSDLEKKKKKPKPRVLKEKQQGIYTVQELEAANFFVEWFKGLRASAPYIVRLTKTFWSLSPTYSSILVTANLVKVVLPSFQLWLRKEFLDQVQRAAEGKGAKLEKLFGLLVLRLCEQAMKQVLELATYMLLPVMDWC